MYIAKNINQEKLSNHVLGCFQGIEKVKVSDEYVLGYTKGIHQNYWKPLFHCNANQCRNCGEDMKLIHFEEEV